MKHRLKLFISVFSIFLFFAVAGDARSEIFMSSAGQKSSVIETVLFSLSDEDILGWEESGGGKYIYFTLSDERNEELARITTENLGQPMRIEIRNTFILVPEITDILNQHNGFVLKIGEGRRLEMLRLLGRDKERKSEVQIQMSTDSNVAAEEE